MDTEHTLIITKCLNELVIEAELVLAALAQEGNCCFKQGTVEVLNTIIQEISLRQNSLNLHYALLAQWKLFCNLNLPSHGATSGSLWSMRRRPSANISASERLKGSLAWITQDLMQQGVDAFESHNLELATAVHEQALILEDIHQKLCELYPERVKLKKITPNLAELCCAV